MLSTKNLVFKERPVCKLVKKYVGPYEIEEVVSSNAMKIQLPTSMRIHLVVNVISSSQTVDLVSLYFIFHFLFLVILFS